MSQSLQNTISILGHRGARAEILENTKEGFIYTQKLLSNGLSGIELDIQITDDKQLLITHDNSLNRMCKIQGRLEQLTADFCQKSFFNETGYTLPTLEDVVVYWKGYSHVELELKTHSRMNNKDLVNSLAVKFFELGLDKKPVVLTSFDEDLLTLLQYHNSFSAIPRGLLIEETHLLPEVVNTALRLGCCQIGLKYDLITPKIVMLAKRYNLKISAWTVNDLKEAKRLISLGVDTIITDYPTKFLQENLHSSK